MTKTIHPALAALVALFLLACSGNKREEPTVKLAPPSGPAPRGPGRIVLLDKPLLLQDEEEPFLTRAEFEFELPAPPRRARLHLRYTGVPGALSEDYKMGRYRHKLLINDRHLMDLNTHSDGPEHLVEYRNWLSVRRLKRHNKITFVAGDDQSREGRPNCGEFELRHLAIEFEW